jgi:hypothetical protein
MLTRTVRDTPDSQGRWFHVTLFVNAAGVEYRCAIDVDSHQSNTGVEWRLVHVSAADVAVMLAQDGGTLAEQPNGSWIAFINKFTSQSNRTDDQGHPLP